MSNFIEFSTIPRTQQGKGLRSPISKSQEIFHAIIDDRSQQCVVYHPATMAFFESSRAAAEAVHAWEHARVEGVALLPEQEGLAQRTLQALKGIVSRKS